MKLKKSECGKVMVLAVTMMIGTSACRATLAGDPDRPIKIEAHITLDVRQVKEEAHSIEDIVSGRTSGPSQKPQAWLEPLTLSTAWALEMTDEVKQAIASRQNRFSQINSYKDQGLVGEDREGHVANLGGGPDVQALVDAENKDREVIYRATVNEKSLPPEAISTIRAAFAEEQRDRAKPGHKIQFPSGEWKTK